MVGGRELCIFIFWETLSFLPGEPPSYDSLFGRILDTHKASRNLADFLLRLVLLLIGTIGCTIACSVTVVIPVVMIVVGAVHFGDCPAEPYIPVFLVVGGALLVVKYLIGVVTRVRRGPLHQRPQRRRHRRQRRRQQRQQQRQPPSSSNATVSMSAVDPCRGATNAYAGGANGTIGTASPFFPDKKL